MIGAIKKHIYPIFVFLAGCLWGTSGIFVRGFESSGISMPEIVFIRALFSAIAITVLMLIINRNALKIRLKDCWVFIGTGIVGILGTSFTYFTTIELSSMAFACVMMYTAPIFVAVFSRIFFKEKLTILKIMCLIITFVGCILCCYTDGGLSAPFEVVLLGLGSGLTYASYSIFSRFAINKNYSTETIVSYSFIFMFVGSLVFLPYQTFAENLVSGKIDFLNCLGVGIISTALPYIFYTLGLKGVENGKASIISCIEIVSATILGLIVFSEVPSALSIIGMITVIVGVVMMNIKKEDKLPSLNDNKI